MFEIFRVAREFGIFDEFRTVKGALRKGQTGNLNLKVKINVWKIKILKNSP